MKHSEIRQKIIETASFLFYKNGYNSTGINEIISEAGIAKATLYSHFKSKEDICLSFLQFKNETFLNEIEAYCKSKPNGQSQLLSVFDFLLILSEDKDFNGCWCLKTISEVPKDNIRIREEIQKQKNSFIQLISELVNDNTGQLSNMDKKTLSNGLYLLYESAVAESHLHQSNWPIKEAKALFNRLLI